MHLSLMCLACVAVSRLFSSRIAISLRRRRRRGRRLQGIRWKFRTSHLTHLNLTNQRKNLNLTHYSLSIRGLSHDAICISQLRHGKGIICSSTCKTNAKSTVKNRTPSFSLLSLIIYLSTRNSLVGLWHFFDSHSEGRL